MKRIWLCGFGNYYTLPADCTGKNIPSEKNILSSQPNFVMLLNLGYGFSSCDKIF
jgi:hypothetical protein